MVEALCNGCGGTVRRRAPNEVGEVNFCSRACLPVRTCACGREFRARWRSSVACKPCRDAVYRDRTRQDRRAKNRAAYAANPEMKKRWAREAYRRDRPRHDAQGAEWARRNPDARRAIAKRWREKRPEVYKARHRRRRTRLANAIGAHTEAEWHAICRKQHGRCAGCRERRTLTRDHVVPLAAGGTDYACNIQGLCLPCNSRKCDRIAAGTQGTLFDRRHDALSA